VMMLNHLAESRHDENCRAVAGKIKAAYDTLLADSNPATLTKDLGGQAGTKEFTAALIAKL